MKLPSDKDPLGNAIFAYFTENDETELQVYSTSVEDEALQPAYFFRTYKQMPKLEQIALGMCKGKILDVGAGAGCHSLYLQKGGFKVTALEQSTLCCKVMTKQGIRKVYNEDIFQFEGEKFDTILMLMNGIGIAGTPSGLERLLLHLKSLLNPKGSIILDSSDLIYLYEEEDGSVVLDINSDEYYGEISFCMAYKKIMGDPFKWLFADQVLLHDAALKLGLKTTIVEYGEHYDYLATLTLI